MKLNFLRDAYEVPVLADGRATIEGSIKLAKTLHEYSHAYTSVPINLEVKVRPAELLNLIFGKLTKEQCEQYAHGLMNEISAYKDVAVEEHIVYYILVKSYGMPSWMTIGFTVAFYAMPDHSIRTPAFLYNIPKDLISGLLKLDSDKIEHYRASMEVADLEI